MFAAAVKETEARDSVRREKERTDRAAAEQREAERRAHEDALATARRDLDKAIAAVRAAKRDGRSTVEADAVWKAAKARVIELETGALPAWAPPVADEPADSDGGEGEGDGEGEVSGSGEDSPVDDAPLADEQP